MRVPRLCTSAACAALLLAAGGLRAEDSAKAEKAVKEFLADKKVDAPIAPVTDEG